MWFQLVGLVPRVNVSGACIVGPHGSENEERAGRLKYGCVQMNHSALSHGKVIPTL
jgi:hypothetical protein